jgi:hypothetical protein
MRSPTRGTEPHRMVGLSRFPEGKAVCVNCEELPTIGGAVLTF